VTAIALIGGDGSGKTTVARRLVAESSVPMRYLYMGLNPDSSNVALPTTRLVHALKVRRAVDRAGGAMTESEARSSLHKLENRDRPRSAAWMWARLANRLAEEIVRQVLSWWYQARRFVVIYDRHFVFDHTPSRGAPTQERIHEWFLAHLYPKPDLVLFLDAPGEVLWPRTREVPAEHLDARRMEYLGRAGLVREFRVVSVDRDLEAVFDDVSGQVRTYLESRRRSGGRSSGGNK
jgi:thymidylate kinase